MATIADVAKSSGVSIASVSYVLNNRQGVVSAETRERVLQAMRDLNYRPSPLFTRKHAKKAEVLGVAFLHPSLTLLTDHPYFSMILDGILSETTAIDWDLILFTTKGWYDFHKTMRSKCDGRCDGLILIGMAESESLVEALKERGMPFVCINMGSEFVGVNTVDVDNEEAARSMTEYLLGLGHRRIAMLSGQDAYPNSKTRMEGYLAAIQEAGIAPVCEYMPTGGYHYESGYDRALDLFKLPESTRPTAIFCGSDKIAFGAMEAARISGLKVPQDVSIAGFNDEPGTALSDPPLTTVRQPLVDIGVTAARILLNQVNEMVPPGQKKILPTELIIRGSTARP